MRISCGPSLGTLTGRRHRNFSIQVVDGRDFRHRWPHNGIRIFLALRHHRIIRFRGMRREHAPLAESHIKKSVSVGPPWQQTPPTARLSRHRVLPRLKDTIFRPARRDTPETILRPADRGRFRSQCSLAPRGTPAATGRSLRNSGQRQHQAGAKKTPAT